MSETTPPFEDNPTVPLTPNTSETDPFLAAPVSIPEEESFPIAERLELARSTAAMRSIIIPPASQNATMRQFIGLGVGLGIALLLMFFCVIALLSSSFTFNVAAAPIKTATPRPKIIAAPPSTDTSGYGFATQVSNPTALPFNSDIPTAEPTITPIGGPPTATPAPPTATPMPSVTAGIPASFTVAPNTLSIKCDSLGTGEFTINNTGATSISWQVKGPAGYTFNPSSGTIPPGESHVTVAVAGIATANTTPNGSIIVSDSSSSAQTITVTCK